jgi:aspartyl-tRNA synthetase
MRLSRSVSLALLVALLIPTLAWKGGSSGSATPIAEVLEKAESGDVVTVDGWVADSTTGSGSLLIVTLQDESGQVLVAVPDSLIRKIDARTGEAAGGQRYRVTGRWDHQQMNTDTWGIHAQQIDRLPAR